uniref:AB hydrolase-1 domain-containing protein n=1 Tax=Aegilops tauschii subsp. strangulata TaxID=200361 RepID=A0A453GH74_AEGTS
QTSNTKPNRFYATQEMESTQTNSVRNHFILVHGLCHGAWCWYKVVTALEAAGHRVTAVDLAASGAHPARVDEVHSFEEYSRPLLDAVAAAPERGGERLILVGHSHGGLSLALAMERFPGKVAAAVFAAAAMPSVGKHMGVTTEEVCQLCMVFFLLSLLSVDQNTRSLYQFLMLVRLASSS